MSKKLTRYDRRFRRLQALVEPILQSDSHVGVITEWHTNTTVAALPDPSDLTLIGCVLFNGQPYSMQDTLQDKAALARDGILGSKCVAWGIEQSNEVAGRLAREAKSAEREARDEKIKKGLRQLWGKLGDVIFYYNIGNKHAEVKTPRVVKTVRWLLKCVRAGVTLPERVEDAYTIKLLAKGIHTNVQETWQQCVDAAVWLSKNTPDDSAPYKELWRDMAPFIAEYNDETPTPELLEAAFVDNTKFTWRALSCRFKLPESATEFVADPNKYVLMRQHILERDNGRWKKMMSVARYLLHIRKWRNADK